MNEKFAIGRTPLNYISEMGLVPLQSEGETLVLLSDGNASKRRLESLEFLAGQPVEIVTLDKVSPEIVRAYLFTVQAMKKLLAKNVQTFSVRKHLRQTTRTMYRMQRLLQTRFQTFSHKLLPCPLHVLSALGVHFDLVTFVHEERHVDHNTTAECCGLAAAGGRVSTHTR